MKTAITVRKKDGTLWAATSVFLTMVDGDANGAMQMNYVCSGILRSCPLADIQEVLWREPVVTGTEAAS